MFWHLVEMLWTLVVILPALAWRIQAQNGITPASIDSDMAFAPTDQGEFGSSENEPEDLTTTASSEVETISSELFTTIQGGFQVNEARILNAVPLPQVTTLVNDDSSETDETPFTDDNGNVLIVWNQYFIKKHLPNLSPIIKAILFHENHKMINS